MISNQFRHVAELSNLFTTSSTQVRKFLVHTEKSISRLMKFNMPKVRLKYLEILTVTKVTF